MKVIVTYRKFHDIEREEIFPEVFKPNENETEEGALRRIWEDHYNSILAENGDDPVDENGCWIKDDMAQIAWKDGDIKEFYIVDVELYM